LGGFTTFSTYVVEVQEAMTAGASRLALAYLGGTLAAAAVAVWVGSVLTSTLIRVLTRTGWHKSKER
jgi:fluoride exporter